MSDLPDLASAPDLITLLAGALYETDPPESWMRTGTDEYRKRAAAMLEVITNTDREAFIEGAAPRVATEPPLPPYGNPNPGCRPGDCDDCYNVGCAHHRPGRPNQTTIPSALLPRTVFTDVTVASAKDATFAVIYEGDGSQSGWTEGATPPSAPLEETPNVCPTCQRAIVKEAHGGEHPSAGHDPAPHVAAAYGEPKS